MRKQIAAANWKMNCTLEQATLLLDQLVNENVACSEGQEVVIAVPFPFLLLAKEKLKSLTGYKVAAQNCYSQASGAFTGEVSAPMLASVGLDYVIVGHSERREIFNEDSKMLSQKVDVCLANGLKPIFCCGEPLHIREEESQDQYVTRQIMEGLFHLEASKIENFVLAYEPIWAIGTGKTATSQQAQDMQDHIRKVFASKYAEVADSISILYGGSVKASNATDIFGKPDVDGGLVGGASLVAAEFASIIRALK
jgi:triosephosphate isomerase (TIM)